MRQWRDLYRKPGVVDECCCVGHGETYLHPEDVLWWSKGGVLHGQSLGRIAFYRRILHPAGC